LITVTLANDDWHPGYTCFFSQERTRDPMSANRRAYRTIRMAIRQLCSIEPKGNKARMLNTLRAMVAGIVQAKSCKLPAIGRKTPDQAKADSRIKRYSRWIQFTSFGTITVWSLPKCRY